MVTVPVSVLQCSFLANERLVQTDKKVTSFAAVAVAAAAVVATCVHKAIFPFLATAERTWSFATCVFSVYPDGGR